VLKSDWRHDRYLFHVHTSYTDGDLTAAQSVDFAEKAGARTVVFLEHIRREPRYDVERFSAEVRSAARESVQTVLGFESKLLPDGTLDIDDDCFERAAVVGMAEHSFPNDPGLLRDTILNVVRTYPLRWPQVIFVWVHPGLDYLRRLGGGEQDEAFQQMLREACGAGVLVEQSLRYGLLSSAMAGRLPTEFLVTGADAHSLSDLERWAAQHPAAADPENRHCPPIKPDMEPGITLL
jgi:histidinol phosphatase-like PHP family hydrolase